MKIRKIEERDAEQCLTWYNYYVLHTTISFEETPVRIEEFRDLICSVTESYPWIVLEADGQLKGYAYLSPFNTKSAYRFSADVTVYLDPSQRGMGYGTALMKALMEEAEKRGIRKLVSLVTVGNTASEHLHEALGFERSAVLHHIGCKFGTWLDLEYYTLDLPEPEAA